MGKGRASPYSTGGGGHEYERMVGATYLAAMMCGDPAPAVDGTITEVRFQQQNAGHALDDIVVVFDKDNSAHRLSLQVKHGLQMGASSKFGDIIGSCWRMFVGGEGVDFDRSTDRLGIVASDVSGNVHKHCLPVIEMARNSPDGATFWDRLKHGGHSKRRLEFTSFVRGAAANYGGSEATDDDVWEFLQLLHIAELNMDGPAAAGLTLAKGICRRMLAEPGEGEDAKLFDALRGVAADLAPAGASITTAALKGRLSSFDLAGHAKTKADVQRLDENSQIAMALIQKAIAGKVTLDRVPLLKGLGELAEAHAMTIIHGEPFAGKSALVRLFAENVPRPGAAIFIGTECLGASGNLGAFLTSQGVRGNLEDILETHGAAPHRYIIIDGLDRISYEPEKIQVVKGLLAAVSRYNAGAAAASPVAGVDTSWKIIATTRSMELEHVENAVKEWCGGRLPAALEVGPLTDEEIDEVRRQLPQLGGDTLRLGGLLSFPGYLDMIAGWQPASLEGVQGAIGAGRLSDLFWKEAVLRLCGLRGGRGHWLAREKILVDMAKKMYKGHPPADLHDLDHEAVDGLLMDRLARIDGNRLAFAHDVIEDYALARMIELEEPRRPLFEDATRRRRLVRPLRICAAKMLEADGSADKWESLLEDCRLADGQIWAREWLLGVADSDEARSNLDAVSGALLGDGGRLLAVLLAALPSAFVRENEGAIRALRERGDADLKLHAARYKLPIDERFSPVLSFALDNMERVGDAAEAEFIRTAAMWSLRGRDRGLKRRIAEYAVQHADWLRGYGRILGQDGGRSDDIRCLIAAIVLYSSDAAPDSARKFLSDTPHIAHNEHFRRALVEKGGWTFLCKFLPDAAVGVLSCTMCTNPTDSGFLQAIPGTRDDGWTNRASPHEGPFYHFLSIHSEHGLDLVHRLLNHATGQWRRAQEAGHPLPPPRIPLPQTVHLESGPVKVYGGEDAFAWGGHARRAPDLVASALMALELWLDVQVERGGEPVATLFERVLRGTDSAAVVGVCCTVALRHMDKTAEAILPILTNPAFWIMNNVRQKVDLLSGAALRARAGPLAGKPATAEGRSPPMRRAGGRPAPAYLSAFVPLLLFAGPDGARAKMQEALAAFPDRIPSFFEGDLCNEKTLRERQEYCEMLSRMADRGSYAFLDSKNTIKIAFDAGRSVTSDEKRAEEQRLARKKASDFMLWSHALIKQGKIGPAFTVESALEYAEQVTIDGLPPSSLDYRNNDAVNGKANFLGALIIHRWDKAVAMGVAGTCLRDFEAMANAIDPLIRDESSYLYGADRAVAYALPYHYLRCNRSRTAKRAILKFADAYNPEVLGLLMEGLCALWDHDDGFVFECIAGARRRFRSKKGWSDRPYTDWTGYAALLPALRRTPPAGGAATEGRLKRVLDDMLDDTIAAFKDLENGRGYGAAHESFTTWCSEFFKTLGSYTAARPELRGGILEKILSHWEAAPPLLASFMQWTLFWGEAEGRDKDLLATWKRLLPAVITSNLLTGYRNGGTRRSIVALLIFADPPSGSQGAKGLDILDEFAPEIFSWCKALAGNRDAVEAIVSLLGSAPPALLLEHGIGWLWQVLRPADRGDISDSTAALLPQLLYRASTYKYTGGGFPDHSAKYEWLVDYVVTFNDPIAESLKDEGKNPYENASGRGRRR